jgi:hypothetical protein
MTGYKNPSLPWVVASTINKLEKASSNLSVKNQTSFIEITTVSILKFTYNGSPLERNRRQNRSPFELLL